MSKEDEQRDEAIRKLKSEVNILYALVISTMIMVFILMCMIS